MKKLVQTTLDEKAYENLQHVTAANASTEASTVRLAILIGLQQLKKEIAARERQSVARQPAA